MTDQADSHAAVTLGRLPRGVWVFAATWTVFVGLATTIKVWAFHAHTFDLGFFTQALGQIARDGLNAPTSLTGWSFLQDHFSPLALPLAPLAATEYGPYLLVVVQAIAVGLSIPIAWRLAIRLVQDERRAWPLIVGYALAPALCFAVWFDFHPSVLSLPFLLLFIDGLEGDDALRGGTGAILASLAREDIALLVALMCAFFWRGRSRWVFGAAAIALAVGVAGTLVTGGDSSGWFLRAGYEYVDLGRPWWTIRVALALVWSDGIVLLLVASSLLPWVGWGRLDPRPLLVGALAALPYLFSAIPWVKIPSYHYYFYLAPLGLWAVARGIRQQRPVPSVTVKGAITVAFIVGPLGAGFIGPFIATVPEVVRDAVAEREQISEAHAALACVPPDVSQSVADPVTPFFADREALDVWPMPLHGFDVAAATIQPILSAPEQPRLPEVVITGSQLLDRVALFRKHAPDLPALGYQRVADSPTLLDIWVMKTGDTGIIATCLSRS